MRTGRKQWRSVARIVALLSILFAQSAIRAESNASRMKRILVFGDSLSDGFRLKRSEAYPSLLAQKLRAVGLRQFEVINASASGGTTDGGLRRLPPHLKHKIDVFILELGINDAFRGEPLDQIEKNLQTIIDQVKSANPNVRIIIAGMQLPNYAADDYVSAFGKIYLELAAQNKAALVPYLLDGVAGDPLLNLADRVHPNAAGHKVLAENVWRALETIAREVTGNVEAALVPQ